MEISSRFAGTTLKPFTAALDWQRMTNYAAATGDANPFYLDDEREGGIVAPPMFAVALTWPIIERVWEFIENPEFPLEVLSTIVHYTEHLQFHKPMRPGGSLEIRGKVAAIVPHRSGTVATLAFDSFDESGKAVFTEHIGAMLRGVH
ncbi:MAG: MaoC family dehydratase N-terminal domain-containing protein, partial [Myxococcota bacterium]